MSDDVHATSSSDDPPTPPSGAGAPLDGELTQPTAHSPRWRRVGAPLVSGLAAVAVIAGGAVAVHEYRTGSAGHPPVLRLLAGPLVAAGAVAAPVVASGGGAVAVGPASGVLLRPGAVVTAGPLPAGTGHGRVYRLPTTAASASAVRRLAAALDVPGTPRRNAAGWVLASGDRSLLVSNNAGQAWNLFRPGSLVTTICVDSPPGGGAPCANGQLAVPAPAGTASSGSGRAGNAPAPATGAAGAVPATGPAATPRTATAPRVTAATAATAATGVAGVTGATGAGGATGATGAGGAGRAGGGKGPAPAPAPSATRRTPQPATPPEAAVRAAAMPVLAALGRADGQLTVQRWPGIAVVSVAPRVGGLPTVGIETRLTFDGQARLIGGSGWLATPTAGPAYPLVSAADALARLVSRQPMIICTTGAAQRCTGPVLQRTVVTGAHRGLALSWEVGGSALLVPAWLYDTRAGTAPFPVIAVAQAYLGSPTAGSGSGATVLPGRVIPGGVRQVQPPMPAETAPATPR